MKEDSHTKLNAQLEEFVPKKKNCHCLETFFGFSKENKQKEDNKKWFLQSKVIPPFIYLFMNKAGQQYHKGNTTNLLQHLEHNFNS